VFASLYDDEPEKSTTPLPTALNPTNEALHEEDDSESDEEGNVPSDSDSYEVMEAAGRYEDGPTPLDHSVGPRFPSTLPKG
jgi:hypothetical protein